LQEYRERIKAVYCIDQVSRETENWDLDSLDDVRLRITEFLRRRTDGGTLEKMLNSPSIPEYRTFNFQGRSNHEVGGGYEQMGSGPFVYQLQRLSAKDYFRILSGPWILGSENRTRKDTVVTLLREMKSQGLLSEDTIRILQGGYILNSDLQFSRLSTTSNDFVKLQAIFADLANAG
jgi:hypothetical protein